MKRRNKFDQVSSHLLPKADVVILTETWLEYHITPYETSSFLAQSKPNRYRGVIVMTGQRISNMQPVLPEFWTECIVATSLQFKNGEEMTQLYVVGVYAPPGLQKKTIKLLDVFVRYCRQKSIDATIIIAGDLNIEHAEATKLALRLGVILAQE